MDTNTEWDWLGPLLDLRDMFHVERSALLELLTRLDIDEWSRPTVCPGWSVRDVATHILHGYLRRLSAGRDGHADPGFVAGEDVVGYVTRSNQSFVDVARQVSPRLLTDLLAHLGPQLDAHWAVRDVLREPGIEVTWAAPGRAAPLWLDIAREYTEFWVHQQQIRDAVGRPGAAGPRMLGPVVDTLLRGLPLALSTVREDEPRAAVAQEDGAGTQARGTGTGAAERDRLGSRPTDTTVAGVTPEASAEGAGPLDPAGARATAGQTVRVYVSGPAGGTWTVRRRCAFLGQRPAARPQEAHGPGGWALTPVTGLRPSAEVEISPDTLWRLATRGMTPATARARSLVRGEEQLADAVFHLTSIVAPER